MNSENFDYQSVSEEQEELNFDKLAPCPDCKKPIPQDAAMCLYCGKKVSRGKKPAWFIWLAVFLIIAFLAFLLI
ncbi:MAG: hypothetical protein ABIH08_02500 [Candidatus Omnitrophota bacterium]